MDDISIKGLIEALLFVSPSPLTIDLIARITQDYSKGEIRKAIDNLREEYKSLNRSFYIEEVAGGYQFRTRAEYTRWIRRLEGIKPPKLSKAALETLAVIAYKQPVIRTDIESIRGVDVGGVLKTLLERHLIKIIGRKEIPGRPIVYGTTKEFLELFGLKDISSLPTLKDVERDGIE
ncbi:MAG: SMC-Scp complex subunit ScpB [Thermodesulfobacteriota bacterium]